MPAPFAGWRAHLWWSGVIGVLLAVIWYPVASFEFINFDDPQYITNNPFVRSGLSWANLRWAFGAAHEGHWHPLTWLSHMLDCQWFGLNAGAHYLHNVLLHIGITISLYALVWRVSRNRWLAVLLALLSGLHPMRIESVAWVTERKDLLGMLWGLLALHAYVGWTRVRTGWRYAALLMTWIISLLCKPTFVTLPLLLLLLDVWPLQRVAWQADRRLWWALLREKIPLLGIACLFSVLVLLAQQQGGGLRSSAEYAFADRLANAWVSYWAYAGKAVLPTGLGIFYPFQRYAPGIGVGAGLALLLVTGWAWRMRSTHRPLWFAWHWFVIALLPMIGVIPIGGQSFADRWSYLPYLGLLWGGLAWGATIVAPRWVRGVGVVAVVACAAWTSVQLPHWRTSETVFRQTLAVSPDNFMAHTNLGVAVDGAGRLHEAIRHHEAAVRLNPTYPEALNNLGGVRARTGALRDAETLFQRALAVRPSMSIARYNLGLVYSQTARPWQSTLQLWDAATVGEVYAPAWQSLRIMAERLRVQCGQTALQLTPEEAVAQAAVQARLGVGSADSAVVDRLRTAIDCQ